MRTVVLPALLLVLAFSASAESSPLDRATVGVSAGLRSREQAYSSLWIDSGPLLASSGVALTYAVYNSPVLLPVAYATVDLSVWHRPLSFFAVPREIQRIAVSSGLRASLQTNKLAEGRLDGLAVGWRIGLGYDAVLSRFVVPRLRAAAILYGDGLWIEGEAGLGGLLWDRLLISAAAEVTASASYFGLGTALAASLVLALELLL